MYHLNATNQNRQYLRRSTLEILKKQKKRFGIALLLLKGEQESEFGGFIGISAELDESSNVGIEFQFTGDADAIGIRYVRRF